ncbi:MULTISPECIES: host attachment protein [unclassified Acidiphilium]|jgi:protein required for attachment to host cells|uniref:host attachment protein n=2 Tax=Acidiphilium TaxID=522 RepID=UPI001F409FB9|nr:MULTISPECIES: host attachment protein [unclassified Acidiphilium]HQT60897.1 host attachment protein [Acidiphilium sp.]
MMTSSENLLIVIADGAQARFVRIRPPGKLETERRFESVTAHLRSSDLRSDGPGAAFHSFSTAHHAVQPRHDPHQVEKSDFARTIASELNALPEGSFGGLILVAPARLLATLRDALGPLPARNLIGTLAHDLVKVPDPDLWPHLEPVLPAGLHPARPVRR